MKINKIYAVHFSPATTSKKIVLQISKKIGENNTEIDFLKNPLESEISLDVEDVLVVVMPVFSGRIPALCVPMLKNLKGNKTPVIVSVAYGNREYEDALLELSDILKEQGFLIIAAAAFIGEHSIFKQVAHNRPDEKDLHKINEFAELCAAKLNTFTGNTEELCISGNNPYRLTSNIPLKPKGDSKCISCGICVKICPTDAIDVNTPRKTDKKKCITCTACITACPEKARYLGGILYKFVGRKFTKKNSTRKEPEWFL